MDNIKKYFKWYILAVLFVSVVFIWGAIVVEDRGGLLSVAFLDVGQGDAVFIESPNGNQVLIDGGSNKKVLRELGELMPFYDRSIDIVMATHPDKDHIGGLPAVLEKFYVDVFAEPGVASDNGVYAVLVTLLEEENIKRLSVKRGERIILDEDVYIDILFPDRETTGWEPNTASVILKLVYGDTSFLLTGDSPKRIEEYVAYLDGEDLAASVLKIGHHGSRTSTSEFFLSAVDPEYAIISAGGDNRYGHPHKEITGRLEEFGISSFATYENGTIIIESDGENIYIK